MENKLLWIHNEIETMQTFNNEGNFAAYYSYLTHTSPHTDTLK